MKTLKVSKMSAESRFLYWIKERHQIHLRRKEGKPKPWTNDMILQSYFFTNPYREHDKTTVWFRKNVRGPMKNEGGVLFATVCFRWFNYIPTGRELKKRNLYANWNAGLARVTLHHVSSMGGKVFTGAFNISNGGSTKTKIDRVCEDYIQPMWDYRRILVDQLERCVTMQHAHNYLKRYLGLGGSGFMAYEIVCDLRYTYLLREATDKCTWSNPGPGAKRGVNRLLDRELKAPVKDWPEQSARLLKLAQRRLNSMPPFEMREIEHSLCEFDKYERARLSDGHVKRGYAGI